MTHANVCFPRLKLGLGWLAFCQLAYEAPKRGLSARLSKTVVGQGPPSSRTTPGLSLHHAPIAVLLVISDHGFGGFVAPMPALPLFCPRLTSIIGNIVYLDRGVSPLSLSAPHAYRIATETALLFVLLTPRPERSDVSPIRVFCLEWA
jgi:hypothetical protein